MVPPAGTERTAEALEAENRRLRRERPLTLALDVAPEPRMRLSSLSRSSPFDFELGQIAATPDDLRHRPAESYRPVLLSLLVAATLPLGLLGHSWRVEAQLAGRRD